MVTRALEELAQGLRKAHCARGELDLHECIGVTTIDRDGVTLLCKVCGDGKEPIAPAELLPSTRCVRAIVEAVGLDWDAITPERKRAAVGALERLLP